MSSEFQPPIRTGLLDFLKNSSGCQFVIPVYQRNYTWTAGKEVKQYLDDLKSVLIGEHANHFLGIIIYIDTPIDFATREFSVIDGQQRLTTTFLILYAIRDLMKKQNAAAAINNLEGQFLTNPFNSNDRIKYKLKPLVSDDEVYQYIIKDKMDELDNKESKIYKNYMYILKYIRDLSKSYDYNQILLALNKLYLVCIPLSSDDNAQKIFESINATGVKLTASDLIRNFLLMDLDSGKQERYYKEYWMQLEKYLSDDSRKLENFFRFYLGVKTKSLPNKNGVYKSFVKWYKSKEQELGRIGIFEDIIKFAKYYFEIYLKDLRHIDSELIEPISEFRQILSDMPAPLLMGMFDLYAKEKINSEQLSEIIYIINSYLIRRALCGISTSSISKLFTPLLKDIERDCQKNYENIVDLLKKNLVFKNINNGMYVPDNKQLYNMIINSNMYKFRSYLRIFFDKLEHENNPAPVELKELSVEHIMPQTPSKEWYDSLAIDEEEYQRNVNRLGNLTLAAKVDNSKMQNRSWPHKKKILSQTSHLIINQDILKKDQWNIQDIEYRTEQLIKEINRLFPYPKVNDQLVKIEQIFLKHSNIQARANFYIDNGDVEILEGSELHNFENVESYPEIEDWRHDLLEEGVIYNNGEKLIFKEPYMVSPRTKNSSALSGAAELILHGARNGWEYWINSEGKRLRNVDEIASRYNVGTN